MVISDSRVWSRTLVKTGHYSTLKREFVQEFFSWFLIGVYAPRIRSEKLECWEEVAAFEELRGGPWIGCGDFNTIRYMDDRRGCIRITNVMSDCSRWIEDMELHDPLLLNGGKFTWFRGKRKSSFEFENWWLKHELAELDLVQDNRVLTEDEMVVRATILVELEVLAKNEESTWTQHGDNNTRFYAHEITQEEQDCLQRPFSELEMLQVVKQCDK
ncbi:hypothetical protein H5410_031566 [Solanum commersonii]|uniref:Non-LTR retroelement reverse transcriptase n=1 Tax=Solanum commersonii TaxID=4109 RepID=A0A9J5YM37_SOLCO|nr:hypothetical protein H5410_031566 [Solanum commersonii]